MQLPAWKPAELLPCLGGFEGEQKLAQLVGHRGRRHLGVPVLVKLLQPLYGESGQAACRRFMNPVCTVNVFNNVQEISSHRITHFQVHHDRLG